MQSNYKTTLGCLLIISSLLGCKKMIQISPPVGSITTSQVFSTDKEAISAASGMYYKLINTNGGFSSYATAIFGGMSADELILFQQTIQNNAQFQHNSLTSDNPIISTNFWANAYSVIYTANALIAGLDSYSGVHDSVKNELIGEAKFVRAFCNFYLFNLFGNIPLVTTVNWHNTNLLSRSDSSEVYQAITSDLKDAQLLLAADYSAGNGQRIVPNRWVATALLARVYLYQGKWSDAEAQATAVINSNLYDLPDLNTVFLTSSTEAIWQLQQNNNGPSLNATPEGFRLIPRNASFAPFVYLTPQLLSSFETDDQRKVSWIDSTIYAGTKYYFPYKYKMGPFQATSGGPYSEYYMIFRLGEQYLIRAESRAQQGNLSNAVDDLNTIRKRAQLPFLPNTTLSQVQVLAATAHERQIELFTEWGHRWMDLKRTGQAIIILQPIKSGWTNNALLYPIPLSELKTDPNLIQNNGY